jgi:hypothetical protein
MAESSKGSIGLLIGLGGKPKPGKSASADDPRESAARAVLDAIKDDDAMALADALDMLHECRESGAEAKPEPGEEPEE